MDWYTQGQLIKKFGVAFEEFYLAMYSIALLIVFTIGLSINAIQLQSRS